MYITLSASATVVTVAEVLPSIIFISAGVEVISVPPISSDVTTNSPSIVARPDVNVIKSVSPDTPMSPPSTLKSPAMVVYDEVGVEFPFTVIKVSS